MNSQQEIPPNSYLLAMTKEELIEYVIKLENAQIKPRINSKAKRSFLHRHKVSQITTTRPIALLLMYTGWEYSGMARQCQECPDNTIEGRLVVALQKSGLGDSECNMQRSGRTDKGVSAISQVVSLNVRSKITETSASEFNYTAMLNSVLPNDIRVLAWSPVGDLFHARHSCKNRTYVYLFPAEGTDIQKMNSAAQFIVGTHDFANFCCKSNDEIKTTTRTVLQTQVTKLGDRSMGQFTIKATGFLYHQVRMVIRCLLLVGKGLEDPSFISRLLDTSDVPVKPSYGPAPAFPLVFYHVSYGEGELSWVYDPRALERVHSKLIQARVMEETKAAVIGMAEEKVAGLLDGEDLERLDNLARDRMFLNTTGVNYKHILK